jgi:hypothetical protein
MAPIWDIGIAPENAKSRIGQVTRRTASLRKKSDAVEAEKGLCRMRATGRTKMIGARLGDTL